ncbi:unnamed protein product [Pleuronectes platessa]|uniref:Uncharacterized protein n=1 Tax=Pleuronectes platessa TaxID=8262 RepID=A0A9N7U624_PLEPL|nr:unnamed protein product [Pleuronectes platessa]
MTAGRHGNCVTPPGGRGRKQEEREDSSRSSSFSAPRAPRTAPARMNSRAVSSPARLGSDRAASAPSLTTGAHRDFNSKTNLRGDAHSADPRLGGYPRF